ncbi:MAG: hypothetical protein AAF664_24380 [Planctomycetota bacterium]
MSSQSNRDEILYSFSVESDHGPDVLAKYVDRFPELRSELVELAWELNASRFDEDQAPIELADPRFEEALSELLSAGGSPQRSSDPFSRFRGKRFAEISQELGVSRGFMIGIRDRRVREDSIPERFLSAASQIMEIALKELRHYLREEPGVLGTAEFKADQKPMVIEQVTFRQLIEDTEMTEVQRSTALGYLEDVRSD